MFIRVHSWLPSLWPTKNLPALRLVRRSSDVVYRNEVGSRFGEVGCESVAKKFVLICVHLWLIFFACPLSVIGRLSSVICPPTPTPRLLSTEFCLLSPVVKLCNISIWFYIISTSVCISFYICMVSLSNHFISFCKILQHYAKFQPRIGRLLQFPLWAGKGYTIAESMNWSKPEDSFKIREIYVIYSDKDGK